MSNNRADDPRELCLDAYAVIDVLAKGIGQIATPDGFVAFWNRTCIELERIGGKPFEKRMAVIADKDRQLSVTHHNLELSDSERMRRAIVSACTAVDVHLMCSYPKCGCKATPVIVRAAITSWMEEVTKVSP